MQNATPTECAPRGEPNRFRGFKRDQTSLETGKEAFTCYMRASVAAGSHSDSSSAAPDTTYWGSDSPCSNLHASGSCPNKWSAHACPRDTRAMISRFRVYTSDDERLVWMRKGACIYALRCIAPHIGIASERINLGKKRSAAVWHAQLIMSVACWYLIMRVACPCTRTTASSLTWRRDYGRPTAQQKGLDASAMTMPPHISGQLMMAC